MRTVNAMRALGIKIEQPEATKSWSFTAKGECLLRQPQISIAVTPVPRCVLSQVLAGRTKVRESLNRRSGDYRSAQWTGSSLRFCEMGASVVAEGPDGTSPLRISGGSLRGIQYRPSVASAHTQRRIAAGGSLRQRQNDECEEPTATRNHMEKMLNYFLCADDYRS